MPVGKERKVYVVVTDPGQKERWERAAAATERNLSAWARYHLERAASLDLQQHGIRDEFATERRRAS